MSLLVRPVLLANLSSSDDMFSGKLTERTERIPCLLSLQYTTRSCLSSYPPSFPCPPSVLVVSSLGNKRDASIHCFLTYNLTDAPLIQKILVVFLSRSDKI